MKVCFIYDAVPEKKYLEILSKMTPKRSGIWKDMVGVSNLNEADWYVVIDKTSKKLPSDRTIYVSAHPIMDCYTGYVLNYDKTHHLDNSETFGFGEWWIDYDYDYLSALKPMPKTKDVCYILTDSGGRWGKDERKALAKKLWESGKCEVWGRIIKDGIGLGELGTNTPDTYWFGKEKILEEHRYSVEIDHGTCKNYFSERFFDSLLMWCMPLYWGSTNVHEFIPKDAFKYIDVRKIDDVLDVIKTDLREKNLNAIAEARDLLLNKYQIWARIHEYIKLL